MITKYLLPDQETDKLKITSERENRDFKVVSVTTIFGKLIFGPFLERCHRGLVN